MLRESLEHHPGKKFGPQESVDYVGLSDHDTIAIGDYTLRVVTTPGHTPGHICLYEPDAKFFISGDHVLGDITPHIQAWGDGEDPLGEFITSLQRVDTLDIDLCLPGHRELVEDCSGRIGELIEHHHERAAEVVAILDDGPKTAYDIAGLMTWDIRARSWEDFPVMQRWFATGEAIAHIRFLEARGSVGRASENGLVLYENQDGPGL